jgi:hypothetical protein
MGIVIDSNGVIDIAASTPGKYRITYTTTGTCPSSSFQDVTINALPTISIADPTGGFCSGSSTTITTTVSAGTVFAWYKDDVLIVGQTGSTLTVTEAAEYKATVTDSNGCTSLLSDGLDIEEFDSPTVTIATVPGTTICTGDTATLTANVTGGTGTMSYLWSNSDTNPAISVAPTTTTTYTVTVTDDNGCTGTASQEITPSTNATAIASINNDAAMSFNGVDSYVDAGNDVSLQFSSSFTISAWVNIDLNDTGDNAIISKDSGASNGAGYHISFRTGNSVHAWSYDASSKLTATGLTTNTWYHIVFIFESTGGSNGNQSLYINAGTPVTNTITNFAASTIKNLRIGESEVLSGFNTDGKIDEVAIWDSALSSCDVKGIYEATTTVNGQPKSANLLDTNTTIPAPVYWNRMGDS